VNPSVKVGAIPVTSAVLAKVTDPEIYGCTEYFAESAGHRFSARMFDTMDVIAIKRKETFHARPS
jgi:hypothetical protein